jgi:hypothetical protein
VHGKGPCLFSLDHTPGRLFDASDEFCEVSPSLIMGDNLFIKISGIGMGNISGIAVIRRT